MQVVHDTNSRFLTLTYFRISLDHANTKFSAQYFLLLFSVIRFAFTKAANNISKQRHKRPWKYSYFFLYSSDFQLFLSVLPLNFQLQFVCVSNLFSFSYA